MEVVADGFVVCEAPVHDPGDGLLLVSDAIAGGLWRIRREHAPEPVVPHRRAIGGACLHAGGGVVVSGRNVAHKDGSSSRVLLAQDGHPGFTHFNDLTVDAAGRLYVGLVDMGRAGAGTGPTPGVVFRLDLDGSAQVVAEGIESPNGIGFSPDGARGYVCDTFGDTLWAFDVGPGGDLRDRRPLARWDGGGPDGIAMASDGSMWVALHFGGAVVRLADDGTELERLALPAPPTSACFGGQDGTTLYVTTGDVAPDPRRGSVFATRVGVPGHPVPPARVAGPESVGGAGTAVSAPSIPRRP